MKVLTRSSETETVYFLASQLVNDHCHTNQVNEDNLKINRGPKEYNRRTPDFYFPNGLNIEILHLLQKIVLTIRPITFKKPSLCFMVYKFLDSKDVVDDEVSTTLYMHLDGTLIL